MNMYVYPVKKSFSWYNKVIKEGRNDDQETSRVHQPHDKGYKYLLSKQRNFLELLHNFVKRDWVQQIDENELVRVDKSFILPDFADREADQIYRTRLAGREVIFYVLLELQSSVDYQMPFRLLLYMTEIWRQTVKEAGSRAKNKSFCLPVIIPIVLYNGERPWTVNHNFKGILDGAEEFQGNLLDFEYILIDVYRYSQKELSSIQNLMASVLLLDQAKDITDLLNRLESLVNPIAEWETEQFQMFKTWLAYIATKNISTEKHHEMMQIIKQTNVKEVTNMIDQIDGLWKKGLEKKFLEGKQEGKQEGIIHVARRLLGEKMSVEQVMQLTDLPREEIENLGVSPPD